MNDDMIDTGSCSIIEVILFLAVCVLLGLFLNTCSDLNILKQKMVKCSIGRYNYVEHHFEIYNLATKTYER